MNRAADPRCPECDGPISATTTYCLHCKADLTDRVDDSADVTDADDWSWDPGQDERGPVEGLLAPDGLVDDSLTVVVAVVTGAVAGVLALVVSGLATLHWISVPIAVSVWLGTTIYLARRRTVREAFRLAAFVVAALLVLVPTTAFSPALEGGDFGGRVVLFVFASVVLGVPAVVLALFGYSLGRRGSDGPG